VTAKKVDDVSADSIDVSVGSVEPDRSRWLGINSGRFRGQWRQHFSRWHQRRLEVEPLSCQRRRL